MYLTPTRFNREKICIIIVLSRKENKSFHYVNENFQWQEGKELLISRYLCLHISSDFLNQIFNSPKIYNWLIRSKSSSLVFLPLSIISSPTLVSSIWYSNCSMLLRTIPHNKVWLMTLPMSIFMVTMTYGMHRLMMIFCQFL